MGSSYVIYGTYYGLTIFLLLAKHRKLTLYLALDAENWRDVIEAENIEDAVQRSELKILSIMNKCMPLKNCSYFLKRSHLDDSVGEIYALKKI